MKATSLLVRSSRFPIEWSDEPDTNPPPGRQAAQALLDELRASNRVKAVTTIVQDDDHAHQEWFFFFDFGKVSCTVSIAATPVEHSDLWMIRVSKNQSILKALFGKRDGRYLIPDECLELLASSVRRVFEVSDLQWLADNEAVEIFWKEPERSR